MHSVRTRLEAVEERRRPAESRALPPGFSKHLDSPERDSGPPNNIDSPHTKLSYMEGTEAPAQMCEHVIRLTKRLSFGVENANLDLHIFLTYDSSVCLSKFSPSVLCVLCPFAVFFHYVPSGLAFLTPAFLSASVQPALFNPHRC